MWEDLQFLNKKQRLYCIEVAIWMSPYKDDPHTCACIFMHTDIAKVLIALLFQNTLQTLYKSIWVPGQHSYMLVEGWSALLEIPMILHLSPTKSGYFIKFYTLPMPDTHFIILNHLSWIIQDMVKIYLDHRAHLKISFDSLRTFSESLFCTCNNIDFFAL